MVTGKGKRRNNSGKAQRATIFRAVLSLNVETKKRYSPYTGIRLTQSNAADDKEVTHNYCLPVTAKSLLSLQTFLFKTGIAERMESRMNQSYFLNQINYSAACIIF